MNNNTSFIEWWSSANTAFSECKSSNDIIERVSGEIKKLGFDHFAYGKKKSVPFSRASVNIDGTYPIEWVKRYKEKHYFQIDPSIACRASDRQFVIWQDSTEIKNSLVYQEAGEWGINFGATWTQRSMDHSLCILGISRNNEQISPDEKINLNIKMRCLIDFIEEKDCIFSGRKTFNNEIELSQREEEILKWIADGKCSKSISYILGISENTVNYHIKKIQSKFGSANRTLAAAYSAALGII